MRSACTLGPRYLKLTLPYVIIVVLHYCDTALTNLHFGYFCLYRIKFKYTEFELYRKALPVVHTVGMCVVVNGIMCCPHCRYVLQRALYVVQTVDVLYRTALHVVHTVGMCCTEWHYMLSAQ